MIKDILNSNRGTVCNSENNSIQCFSKKNIICYKFTN